MSNSDNFHPVRNLSVQQKVVTNDIHTHLRRDVRTCGAKGWVVGEVLLGQAKPIQHLIGGGRVVGGDVQPDFDQVIFRAGSSAANGQDASRRAG